MKKLMQKKSEQRPAQIIPIEKIPGMERVEQRLKDIFEGSRGYTKKICLELLESGGKRMRPMLVLSAAQCFGDLNEDVINTAVAYELIHMASLVHDDIIDVSLMRRGRITLNSQKGNLVSVLVGDYLFAKAFEILAKNHLIQSMILAVEAIKEMCDGEIIQSEHKYDLEQTIEDYYLRIYKKTAVLISSCCQSGAILGGADSFEIEAMKKYGENLGYAFQIIDDILDFIGDPKLLGKPVGSDLKDGNVTLPILKLVAQAEYKEGLKQMIRSKETLAGQQGEIIRLLQDSYALKESHQEAISCIDKAKDALYQIKDSPYRNFLMEIADKVVTIKY